MVSVPDFFVIIEGMAEVYFLGTAGSVASARRDNTGFLVAAAGCRILVDCPGSTVHKLAGIGVDFRRVRDVFFTHAHADHTAGFPTFLQSRLLVKGELRVYGHGKTLEVIRRLIRLYGLDKGGYPKTILREVSPGKAFFRRPGLKAASFPVSHLPGSLGYRFTLDNSRTLVFSGDTAYSTHVKEAARSADLLIHDCFAPERIFRRYPRLYSRHTSSLQLGILAAECGARTLVPVHFGTEVSYCFREILAEIRKNYGGKLIIPRDGGKLAVGR